MFDWIQEHKTAAYCLTAGSLVMFVTTLLAVPALIVRIPADYFAQKKRPPSRWACASRSCR